MKVIGFNGGHRKGFNTKSLVRTILEDAEQKGAETKLYDLAKIYISGCIGKSDLIACTRITEESTIIYFYYKRGLYLGTQF